MPRGNPQNLNPVRSNEEARKRGRAGGIKSGEIRRQRKTLRDELLALLSAGNTQNEISLALIQEARSGNNAGSVTKAFETIRDTIGEKPADKIIVAEVSQDIINDIEKTVLEDDDDTK